VRPARRLRLGALAALAAGHLGFSLFAVVPGYLSIDEATYHLMAKYQSETGGFEVWNGYRELPSPELISASITAHDGRLAGRPPALYPALAVPFYRLAGYRGLFALNAVAFAGAAALVFVLARRLFGDLDLALDSVLVLVVASFAWEYSQAAWTHATALLFTLGGFTLAVQALLEKRPRRGAALAAAAGLVAGLAVGIRLDGIFLLAAVLLLFLFRSPWLPGRALAAAAGAAPALAALAAINRQRFGIFSPLSMGTNVGLGELARYLPPVALGAAALVALWGLTRRPVGGRLRRRRAGALVAAGLVLLALAVPASRRLLAREAVGAYTLGVDLRALDLERREPAMLRSDNRAVLYIGGVKKALVQSCPYLVLLLLPALHLGRRQPAGDPAGADPQAGRLAILFLVPLAYFGFYAQFSWHGGLSLNLRYLTAILPYTSILTAWALRRPAARPDQWRGVALAAGAAAALFLGVRASLDGIAGDELLVQTMPLALAGALLVALLLALRRGQLDGDRAAGGTGSSRAVAGLAAAALAWAALTAFAYDLPLARQTRRFNLDTGRRAMEIVAPDSLFFADFVDPFFLLIERGRVRIARPGLDRYRDMPRLAAHHLAAGRSVYGAFPPRVWELLADGPLAGFAIEPRWQAEAFVLAAIAGAEAGGQAAGSPSPGRQASMP
jgi:4-amino-4-deoxy-L-arabinose transferase-like glycosyltransferase